MSNTATGTLYASGTGAHVDLKGATISGGTLKTSGTGALFEVQSGSASVLEGTTIGSAATVELMSGGTAQISGTVHNSGTLFASGAGSLLDITSGAVVSGGVIRIGDGTVEIETSGSEAVTFLSTGTGGLVIADDAANPTTYSGRITGFGGVNHANSSQFIELADVMSDGTVSASYSSAVSHTSGTLTVMSGGSGGTAVASLTLIGNYTTSNFQVSAGSGGHGRDHRPGGGGRRRCVRARDDARLCGPHRGGRRRTTAQRRRTRQPRAPRQLPCCRLWRRSRWHRRHHHDLGRAVRQPADGADPSASVVISASSPAVSKGGIRRAAPLR